MCFRFPLLPVCAAMLCLSAGQQVVIRTNVHMVEVSVIATNSKGMPVSGLNAADLRVFDNGKEQTIASFEKIVSRTPPGQAGLPPNTYSNRVGKQGRPQVLSMILLDAVNTSYRNQTVMLRAVEHILEQIQPEEGVAIYAFGSRFVTIHDFSSDKASLLAKLRKYHGEAPDGADILAALDVDLDISGAPPPPNWLIARTLGAKTVDTFEALEAIANRVKGVPGRKNLLWISAGIPLSVGQPQIYVASRVRDPNAQAERAAWRTFSGEMGRAMAALNDAGVAVYPIDARGLSKGDDIVAIVTTPDLHGRPATNVAFNDNIATMEQMASATGGKAFHDRNDREQGVREALDDSREVYVLTYYPKAIAEDGAYHQIRVRSARAGVQLRFRRGYYATAQDEDRGDRLARALSSPLDSSEIGMQASVDQTSGNANEVTVALRVDPADLSLAHNTERWTGSIRMVGVQIGATGERYEGQSQTAQLDLLPATYQRALEQGVRLELRLKREPAAVAVRIAVVDEGGARVGSLSVPLPPAR
jgi:VWFA-related protein